LLLVLLTFCAALPQGPVKPQTEGHSGINRDWQNIAKSLILRARIALLTHTFVNFLANKHGQ
jgi:hypothetical protein